VDPLSHLLRQGYREGSPELAPAHAELKPALEKGVLVESFAGRNYSWWMVNGGTQLLVFALFLHGPLIGVRPFG